MGMRFDMLSRMGQMRIRIVFGRSESRSGRPSRRAVGPIHRGSRCDVSLGRWQILGFEFSMQLFGELREANFKIASRRVFAQLGSQAKLVDNEIDYCSSIRRQILAAQRK